MRKLTLLAMVAALILGLASLAGAAEVKVKGSFEAHGEWTDNTGFADSEATGASEDDFQVRQRLRTRFQFVQSENLMAVLHLEIGDTVWGRDNYTSGTYQVGKSTGGGLSADGVAVEVKGAYLDFTIPETVVNVKVGIQDFTFPGTVFGSAVHSNDSAGVIVSAPITEMVGVTFAWTRPVDVNSASDGADSRYDETDILLLAVPITPEGMKITPWGAAGFVGKDSVLDGREGNGGTTGSAVLLNGVTGLNFAGNPLTLTNAQANTLRPNLEDSTAVYWAGLAFEMTMFDPFVVAADFAWGTWKMDVENDAFSALGITGDELSNTGWMADLSIKYTGLGFGTPELFFAYATGNDEDAFEEGKFGTLPFIGDGYVDGWSIPGSFYFGGTAFSSTGSSIGADKDINIQGHWVLGVALRDVSFVEKLSHTLIVEYIRGTNSEEYIEQGIANGLFSSPTSGLSTKDAIWEIDFNHEYKIYEQLSAILELGYLVTDFDEDVWENSGNDDFSDAWRVQLGLIYKF